MKAISTLFSLTLLFAAGPYLCATESTGKPQQLISPDQVPEGLAKSDWSSIRAAYEAGRHVFQPVDGGWQARNTGQQWTVKFDGRGFLTQPKETNWQWGLEFKSYGFGEQQTEVGGTPAERNEGQRLTYQWDDSVQEWFINDTRGLEHGFIISQPPEADEDLISNATPLSFTLATRGSLRPSVSSDALTVHFCDALNAPVLNYSGLKVWDANGKILPSRFAAGGDNQLRILIEESGARYPLTIDPIAQQACLKASNTGASDQFGWSVAVSGDTVVVGAPFEDALDNLSSASGAAYVFVRSGITWSQQAYLKASNAGASDQFGYSVAVSGDIVVVGAVSEDSSTTGVNSIPNELASNSGAAYAFVRSGTNWSQQAYFKAYIEAPNNGVGDAFGWSVAVSDDTVVVGAWQEDSSKTGVDSIPDELALAFGSGAAYIFTGFGPVTSAPIVGLPSATNVTATSATLGGNVSGDGGASVTGRSIVYSVTSTNSSPVIGGLGGLQISAAGMIGAYSVIADGLSQGASYTFIAYATNNVGTSYTSAGSFTTATAASALSSWATTAGLAGPDVAPTATPFNDGVPNLLKYAFNMNAAGPDVSVLAANGSSGLPQIAVDNSGEEPVLQVLFLRRKGSGLVYAPERSTTLTDFQSMPGTQTVTSIDAQWERVSVQETNPPINSTSGFARVRVSFP